MSYLKSLGVQALCYIIIYESAGIVTLVESLTGPTCG